MFLPSKYVTNAPENLRNPAFWQSLLLVIFCCVSYSLILFSSLVDDIYMTRTMRKQTLRSLSLSYQKKEPRPSFWHDTDFSRIWSMISAVKFWKVGCHTKRRMGAAKRAHPSFGMTTTKILRSVFSWRTSGRYSGWHFCLQSANHCTLMDVI